MADLGCLQRPGQSQHRRHTRGIVGNPRTVQALAIATHLYLGAVRKDGVDVRRHRHAFLRLRIRSRAQPDHIADFIYLDIFKSEAGELLLEPLSPSRLPKRRGGNGCQLKLKVVELPLMRVQPVETGVHLGQAGDARDLLTRCGCRRRFCPRQGVGRWSGTHRQD